MNEINLDEINLYEIQPLSTNYPVKMLRPFARKINEIIIRSKQHQRLFMDLFHQLATAGAVLMDRIVGLRGRIAHLETFSPNTGR